MSHIVSICLSILDGRLFMSFDRNGDGFINVRAGKIEEFPVLKLFI